MGFFTHHGVHNRPMTKAKVEYSQKVEYVADLGGMDAVSVYSNYGETAANRFSIKYFPNKVHDQTVENLTIPALTTTFNWINI